MVELCLMLLALAMLTQLSPLLPPANVCERIERLNIDVVADAGVSISQTATDTYIKI